MATMSEPSLPTLGRRGWTLAGLRVLQVGSGLLGHLLLLTRWSPHPQTDAYLILSHIPWLPISLLLVGGLDMALPVAYHRAGRAGREARRTFMAQVGALVLLGAVAAAGIGGAGVILGGARLGLPPRLRRMMGMLLGATVLPSVLLILGQGLLIAHDRLVTARWISGVQSALTVAGYGLLSAEAPAVALSLTTAGAAVGALLLTLIVTHPLRATIRQTASALLHARLRPLQPEIPRLIAALLSLSAAAALARLQRLIERTALLSLEPGTITAFATAERIWDVTLALIVAAGVMPAYARWTRAGEPTPGLLRWALRRTLALTGLATLAGGSAALWALRGFAGPLPWPGGARVAQLVLVLLPRFFLVSSLQPLIFNHYAKGTPWYPVWGSALGLLVLAGGAFLVIPRWGLPGLAAVTSASPLPGWVILGVHAYRKGRGCES
jgi:peptidoglycan biosynthesis protein MviN/MurJ (putative lipid II flippase)